MSLAVLVAAVFFVPVDDYFPLQAGTRWTYEDESKALSVDTAHKPIDLGDGKTAVPIETTMGGRPAGIVLYQNLIGTVCIVGFQNKLGAKADLLESSRPVLMVKEGKATWDYYGQVPSPLGPIPLNIKGSSQPGPKKTLLGMTVDTVSVEMISRVGVGSDAYEIRQSVLYGKGIGMIEMAEATKAGRNSVKRTLRLVKFEPSQG